MSALIAGQLVNLRDDHPHGNTTFLSPIPKVALLQAQVNDASIALGALSIVYDLGTGTLGDFNLIEVDMSLILGSSAGDDDLGSGRIVSISGDQTSGTITMSWNSDILWEDDAFITILLLWEAWPRFPRFTVSPEVFFKDRDLTYASQSDPNRDQFPVAIMGPGWGGDLVAGSIVITLDGTGSYPVAVGATISTFAWTVIHSVSGASPSIASASASLTTITLDTPGSYWVKLTITDSNGQVSYTVRPFRAHDPTDPPFQIESATRSQSESSGGVSLSFTVSGLADETTIPKKTPIIHWSANTYDGVSADVSFLNTAQYTDREHINFFGYITQIDTTIDEQGRGSVTFGAQTIHGPLKAKYQYPVSLIAETTITGVINEWWKFPNDQLTTKRALHHLFYWHSTAHQVADIFYPTDTRLMVSTGEFTKGSLFDRSTAFSEGRVFARPVCDIYGSVYFEINIQMLNATDRAAVTDTLTLTTEDWRGSLGIQLRNTRPVAYATSSASNWDGTTFTPFCSRWGEIANNEGASVFDAPNLIVEDQDQLNSILGRLVALQNFDIREITMSMAGNWSSAIGVSPQQWSIFSLTGTEDGNHRGIVLSSAKLKPIQVNTTFALNGLSQTTVVWQLEALGRDGETIDCASPDVNTEPSNPPSASSGGIFPTGGTAQGSAVGYKRIYVPTTDKGMFAIEGGSVTQKNTGLTGSFLNFGSHAFNEAFRSLDSSKHMLTGATDGGFVYTLDGCENWVTVASAALPNPTNTAGDGTPPTTSDLDEIWVGFDPQNVNRWYLARLTDPTWNGINPPRAFIYWTEDMAATWTSVGISFGSNFSLVQSGGGLSPHLGAVSPDGNTLIFALEDDATGNQVITTAPRNELPGFNHDYINLSQTTPGPAGIFSTSNKFEVGDTVVIESVLDVGACPALTRHIIAWRMRDKAYTDIQGTVSCVVNTFTDFSGSGCASNNFSITYGSGFAPVITNFGASTIPNFTDVPNLGALALRNGVPFTATFTRSA